MTINTPFRTATRISFAALLAMSLSGCLLGTSNGGGGGGGGGGGAGGGGGGGGTATLAQVQSNVASARTAALIPTTTQLTGTATYRGEVLLDRVMVTTQQGQSDVGDIAGDLEMEFNFAQGAANPITGTASNFRGEINGEAVTVNGTLSTANTTNSNRISEIGVARIDLPAPASGSVYTTSMSVSLAGNLTDGTGVSGLEGDSLLTLQGGPFRGPNGQLIWGAAGGGVDPFSASGAIVQWGGEYYLERQ